KVDVQFAEALLGLDRFEEASKTIESSIAALTEREPSMILARALDLRADIFRATGQRSEATAAKRKARQVRTKVLGAEHDMDLAMLGKSLELANQANALAAAQQEVRASAARVERQITLRNQLILTALLLALITYLVLSRRYERKVAKTVQSANAELETKVAQRTGALEQEMAQRLDAEGQRYALASTLAEAEKLQALGQLTSGVAHDFNNLMTVVTLSAGLLRDSPEVTSRQASQHVENILSAAESASDITASLLAYARKQPLVPEATGLANFVTVSMPLFESTLGEGITLTTAIEPCTISVDRSQLTTAIINLLLNAREALPDNGTVKLEVAELYQVSEDGQPQNWATITVTDDGHGMTATELQRATQPFYTTKAAGHGTGLGLSMVDGFAKQSGGFLHIDSVEGRGTTVALHIPLSEETENLLETDRAQSTRLPEQGLVMIVDDQQPIREVLARLLNQIGLETLSASNATEALTLLGQSARPDLLITDLMMPGDLNGQQLVTEVRKRYGDLPVLIMSGYSSSVELDVEFLHKPFSLDNLREAIGRALVHDRVA
ncbi:MAG: ATP-binding protein, partial [Pseudomonadales bacterium]